MPFVVVFADPLATQTPFTEAALDVLAQAADQWARYIDPVTPISVGVFFDNLGTFTEVDGDAVSSSAIAFAGPLNFFFPDGQGNSVDVGEPISALVAQGVTDFSGLISLADLPPNPNGVGLPFAPLPTDILVGVNTTFTDSLFIGTGAEDEEVPADQFDLLSILVHELGHGLGIVSFGGGGPTGNDVTSFEAQIDTSPGGALSFTGEATQALAGGPVSLFDDAHLSDSSSILSPFAVMGEREFIGPVEVALLADLGIPLRLASDGGDELFGFSLEDDVLAGLSGADTLHGLSGDDSLTGQMGADEIFGGAGADTLFGNVGEDTLDGGTGSDVLDGGISADLVLGADGHDMLLGRRGLDVLEGGSGNDSLNGNVGGDLVSGGDGNDVVNGGIGTDTVFGDDGDDQVLGGGGTDLLSGGASSDTLTGGGGADIFIFEAGGGADQVTDFTPGLDALDLSATALASAADFAASATDSADGVSIELGGAAAVLLLGLEVGDITATDLIFG